MSAPEQETYAQASEDMGKALCAAAGGASAVVVLALHTNGSTDVIAYGNGLVTPLQMRAYEQVKRSLMELVDALGQLPAHGGRSDYARVGEDHGTMVRKQ
jgi:hypothetical protein